MSWVSRESASARPGRPIGLSLAILASAMLFSILPLMQMATLLLITYRFSQVDLTVPGQAEEVAPLAVGGAFTGIDDAVIILQTVMGIIFMVIAVLAWRGRPSWIRFVMRAAVFVLTAVTVVMSAAPLVAGTDLSQGIDSGEAIRRTLLSGRLVLSLLVALYVVWYVNRGPARAFYRGYYLADPRESTTQ